MRGAQYEFSHTRGRRGRVGIRFWFLLLAFMLGTFALVLHWPDNWDEIIINIVRALRSL